MEQLAEQTRGLSIKKDNLSVVFTGHVDAGKSTIGGHLLFLNGRVDKRTLEKHEKESKSMNRESWFWTWTLDTSTEEREKGITVETAKAEIETANKKIILFDAPGHKNFVPSMISGAAQADVAVLVISARRGEFEAGFERSGQTREHATLLRVFGIQRLIVVINKMDDDTVQWAEQRYTEISTKMLPFLRQCGYNTKTDVTFIPVSGFTGDNLVEHTAKCTWFAGKPLLAELDSIAPIQRDSQGAFLLPVTGKYKEGGLVVTGKIEAGRICRGDAVVVQPGNRHTEIADLFEDELELQEACAGQNVCVRLKTVAEDDVVSGAVVCGCSASIECGKEFDVVLMLLNIKNILTIGFTAMLHAHGVSEEMKVVSLQTQIDRKTGKSDGKKLLFAKNEQLICCRVRTEHEICYTKHSVCPALGRFTLRDENGTIAFGKIV